MRAERVIQALVPLRGTSRVTRAAQIPRSGKVRRLGLKAGLAQDDNFAQKQKAGPSARLIFAAIALF